MSLIVALSRAWLAKFRRSLDKVDITMTGPRVSFPTKFSDEPIETRSGHNDRDKSPFYEMDAKRIWGYYYSHSTTYEYRNGLLYADLVSFFSENFNPITENSVDTAEITVNLLGAPYRSPPSLQAHSAQAISYFQKLGKIRKDPATGDWENNQTIRVSNLVDRKQFVCQPVTYFDQIGTNITLDWASGLLPNNSRTIRSGIERPSQGRLLPLSESLLANNLGTAIMFYDRELKRSLIRVRSDKLGSIAQRGLHCTVSGVLEIEPGVKPGQFGFEIFLYGTHHEIKMETHLNRDQYLLFPVAFARELPRGGKPQLFFVAIALVDDVTFENACQNAVERSEYIPRSDDTFFGVEVDQTMPLSEAFTYEGFACQRLAEDFVTANETHLRELIYLHRLDKQDEANI